MNEVIFFVIFAAVVGQFEGLSEADPMYFHSDDGRMPKQIHISFGNDPREIVVSWATQYTVQDPQVHYGLEPPLSSSTDADSTIFRDGVNRTRVEYFHRATLRNLIPGTSYKYIVGSNDGGWSNVFTFTAMRDGQNWSPRLAVYGDLGLRNPQSLPRIARDVKAGMYDAILHVGDFGYDMADNNSYLGDAFMEVLQPVAANVPYMTCPGNHEFHFNFSNYKARFNMPRDNGNMFYSFNLGPMHIISVSTEYYYFVFYGIAQIKRQYDWLVKDLEEANLPENRAKRPWILLFGHRPMYCSCDHPLECYVLTRLVRNGFIGAFGLEPLLKQYGVDITIWGHEHSYERLWPIFNGVVRNSSTPGKPYLNPLAPVHIITGSAGCKEDIDPFKRPSSFSAFRSTDYGYSRLHVLNASHLTWEQVSDNQGGKIIDRIVLVRDRHTPF